MSNTSTPTPVSQDAIPTLSDLLSQTEAARASQALVSVGGQQVLADDTAGSATRALDYAVALNAFALYAYAAGIIDRTDPATATGDDLAREVALYATPTAAVAGVKPFLVTRPAGTTTPLVIKKGLRFLVASPLGGASLAYDAQQGATGEPIGVSLTMQPGQTLGWVLATCETAGAVGNVPAGGAAQFGASLPGALSVSCPRANQPQVPAATVMGAPGTTVRRYRIVGNGAVGQTLPSPITTVTTAAAVLSITNYVHLDWTPGTDGGGVPPVSYGVSVSTDGGQTWELVATVTGTTYGDQGAGGPVVTLPTADTSNDGLGGAEAETDEHLRARAAQALIVDGVATPDAVVKVVLAVAGITDCVAATTGDGTGDVRVVCEVYPPSPVTIAAANAAVQATVALGIVVPPVMVIAPTLVDVTYAVVPIDPAVDPASLEPAIALALTAVLNTLPLGAPTRFSRVIQAMMSVTGVAAIDTLALTLDVAGTSYAGHDIAGSPYTVYRAGTFTRLPG